MMKKMLAALLCAALLLTGCMPDRAAQWENDTSFCSEATACSIKLSTIAYSPEYPDLYTAPVLLDSTLLLTFTPFVENTRYNTALYSPDTGELEVLPIYTWNNVQTDGQNYYYPSGESAMGATVLSCYDPISDTVSALYTTEEGWEMSGPLGYGASCLIWAERNPGLDRSNGFCLKAYDLKTQMVFEIYDHCYGSISYPFTISNGFLCFYTEDAAQEKPYLLTGYDLTAKTIVAQIGSESAPSCAAFSGEDFVWCDRIGDTMHLQSAQEMEAQNIDTKVSQANLFGNRFIIYIKQNSNIYVYDIKQDMQIFSTEDDPDFLKDREYLSNDFTLDEQSGQAVFYCFTKSTPAGERNERIFRLCIVPAQP